jgi:hypothetical protein
MAAGFACFLGLDQAPECAYEVGDPVRLKPVLKLIEAHESATVDTAEFDPNREETPGTQASSPYGNPGTLERKACRGGSAELEANRQVLDYRPGSHVDADLCCRRDRRIQSSHVRVPHGTAGSVVGNLDNARNFAGVADKA